MADRQALVYVDLDRAPHFVGRLWSRVRKGREGATFEYDKTWLENPLRFALEPALILGPGPQHAGADRATFGALGDSAPDRWGRALMRRAERRAATAEERTIRTFFELDYLLKVDDETRQGALRFKEADAGPFVADNPAKKRVPPLVDLPRLLNAAEHVLSEEDTDEDLRLLLAPGSSLGGARPKASVRDRNGHLAIAKFPSKQDEINAVTWEATALSLARQAGINVTEWRLEEVAGEPVLIVPRFDRAGKVRLPFLSAMSMLGAKDNDTRSYLEIADALRQHGASATADMAELWRRIVFFVLISNTDDHLRNHGFLYGGAAGWRLAPAYDLNPVPIDIKPRVLSTAINEDDPTASLDIALEVAELFGLKANAAEKVAGEVARAVSQWRGTAAGLGLPKAQIERVASAFEHADLEKALKL